MNLQRNHKTWTLMVALWLVASCGGGGSEDPNSTQPSTPPTRWDQGNWDQLNWQ